MAARPPPRKSRASLPAPLPRTPSRRRSSKKSLAVHGSSQQPAPLSGPGPGPPGRAPPPQGASPAPRTGLGRAPPSARLGPERVGAAQGHTAPGRRPGARLPVSARRARGPRAHLAHPAASGGIAPEEPEPEPEPEEEQGRGAAGRRPPSPAEPRPAAAAPPAVSASLEFGARPLLKGPREDLGGARAAWGRSRT